MGNDFHSILFSPFKTFPCYNFPSISVFILIKETSFFLFTEQRNGQIALSTTLIFVHNPLIFRNHKKFNLLNPNVLPSRIFHCFIFAVASHSRLFTTFTSNLHKLPKQPTHKQYVSESGTNEQISYFFQQNTEK